MYDRKIKYLELWENGEKIQTAGFVRLEVKERVADIQLKIEKLRMTDNGAYSVNLFSRQKEAKLGEVLLETGRGCEQWEGLNCENLIDTIGYDELEGLYIKLHGNRELRCTIRVIHQEVLGEPNEIQEVIAAEEIVMVPESQMPLEKMAEAEMADGEEGTEQFVKKEPIEMLSAQVPQEENLLTEQELIVPIPLQMEPARQADINQPLAPSKWQQLWNIYPHIVPFEDNRVYLRMKPEDFVVLTKECYPLCSNSFLLHGYYNYNHVILSRETGCDGEQYYIGVPGNFYAKEKQVAVLFGFESFEGKAEPAKNGDFGYYMIKVEI